MLLLGLPMILILLSLYLYSLQLSSFYTDLSSNIIIIYIVSIVSFFIGALIVKFKFKRVRYSMQELTFINTLKRSEKIVKFFFFTGLLFFLIELYYFGLYNLPVLSSNKSSAYLDYGLPILHNYITMLTISGHFYFLMFYFLKKKVFLLYLLIIFVILVSNLSKGVLISLILPILIMSILLSKNKIRILLFSFISIAFIFLFSNYLRSSGKEFELVQMYWNKISGFESNIPFQLFYMYFTSPVYVFNEEFGKSSLLNIGNFSNVINPLLSVTFIKFFTGKIDSLFEVSGFYYNGAWNVAGGLVHPFQDFSIIGSIIHFFIYGVISSYLYYRKNVGIFYFLSFSYVYTCLLVLANADFFVKPFFYFYFLGLLIIYIFLKKVTYEK